MRAFTIATILLTLAGILGWVLNIIAVMGCKFSPMSSEAVLRIVGAFVAPLGAVLGFVPHWAP